MKKIIMMFGVLSSFITPLDACENENKVNDKLIFTVELQEPPSLRYCGSKKIEIIKKYFPDVKNNEPFFVVGWYESKTVQAKCFKHEGCVLNKHHIGQICDSLKKSLFYLPLRYLLSEQGKFKLQGDELCSYESVQGLSEPFLPNIALPHKCNVVIKLNSSALNQYSLDTFINVFRNRPDFLLEDKQDLIDAGIIDEENGKIIHDINSYFADEIKATLFYSRVKKLGCFSLAAAIIMYILYQKFYATAG